MEILGHRKDLLKTSARLSHYVKKSGHLRSYGHPMRQSCYDRGITGMMSQRRTLDVFLLSGHTFQSYETYSNEHKKRLKSE